MVLKKVLFTSVMLAFFSTVACGEWIQPWPVALNVGYLDLGGTVDITNNSIRAGAINGNPQTFQQRLNSAFDDFLWDGPGLTSSTAANDWNLLTGINWCTGQQYMDIIGKTNFHNVTAQANDYLASYGYYGDLDFNGKVELSDIAEWHLNFCKLLYAKMIWTEKASLVKRGCENQFPNGKEAKNGLFISRCSGGSSSARQLVLCRIASQR